MAQHPDWVDLGQGPMVITQVKGDCEFATGDIAPSYQDAAGLAVPGGVAVFINTKLHVWGRATISAVIAELIVGPL